MKTKLVFVDFQVKLSLEYKIMIPINNSNKARTDVYNDFRFL